MVNSSLPARICDECKHSVSDEQCILCGSRLPTNVETEPPIGYYCDECVTMQYDRVGCPRVTNTTDDRIMRFYGKK
jgi:PHD finger-like domain-containing protein 5A